MPNISGRAAAHELAPGPFALWASWVIWLINSGAHPAGTHPRAPTSFRRRCAMFVAAATAITLPCVPVYADGTALAVTATGTITQDYTGLNIQFVAAVCFNYVF
jgi:hypothetical protein